MTRIEGIIESIQHAQGNSIYLVATKETLQVVVQEHATIDKQARGAYVRAYIAKDHKALAMHYAARTEISYDNCWDEFLLYERMTVPTTITEE
jgi:hypothetical protein